MNPNPESGGLRAFAIHLYLDVKPGRMIESPCASRFQGDENVQIEQQQPDETAGRASHIALAIPASTNMPIDVPAQLAYHRALWGDFVEETPPPLLAHYTSLATLEKILRSNEFWLSNPLYMNDWEELRFGMVEGAMAVQANDELRSACGDQSTYEGFLRQFNELFANYNLSQALDAYVLCFSAHDPENSDGVLSMWRGYGAWGSGAALLINTEPFPKFEQFPLTFGKVHYATPVERRNWLRDRINGLAVALKQHDRSDQNLQGAVRYLFERIKLFSIFTKHKGFEEEREWRAVYMRERDQKDLLINALSYAITDRGAEPKLRLDLSHFVNREVDEPPELLAGILLGPTHSSDLSQASVRRMLQVLGRDRLAVHERLLVSTIPLRSSRANSSES